MSRYQSLHSFDYEYGVSLVDLADPKPGERILDVGCGSGELTQALYERSLLQENDPTNENREKTETNITIMGMDYDPSMVEKAKEQFPHLEFFESDVRQLEVSSLPHGQVDLLFSNAALHWVPPKDASRAVASTRVIRPGGRIVFEFGGKGNVEQIARACQEVTGVDYDFWYFPSIADFSNLLQEQGIEVTQAALFDRPTALNDGDDGISNWVGMFGKKFLEHLSSAEEVDQALQAITDKLRPSLWDGEQWVTDYRRIRVVGQKLENTTE